MRYTRLVGFDGLIHVTGDKHLTLCGQALELRANGQVYGVGKGSGSHYHGRRLVRSAVCPDCIKEYDNKNTYLRGRWRYDASFKEALEPIPAIRPLPGRSVLKGIHRTLYNARERVRRKSVDWMGRPTVTQSANAYGHPDQKHRVTYVVPWDVASHNAFMLGANYMLDEILTGFKLREFSQWRDEAYKELAEFVHGELLDDEDIPDDT